MRNICFTDTSHLVLLHILFRVEGENGTFFSNSSGAARLDRLPGCSPPWKMWGKRFRQTAKLAVSLDLVTKISQHNHFRYFRHHFCSTFPRNPTKPMFRCFPTTPLMRWRFQHTCRRIWRFRGCLRHSPKGKKPNNWPQKTWWYIRLSQSVFDILTMNF